MPVTSAGSATILPFVAAKPPRIVMRTISRKAPGTDIYASASGKPALLYKAHEGRFVIGYRHCMYVLPEDVLDPRTYYKAVETEILHAFVLAQDRLRREPGEDILFKKVVARIAKTGLESAERKRGKLWRYSTGESVNLRIVCFGTLKLMLEDLNMLTY